VIFSTFARSTCGREVYPAVVTGLLTTQLPVHSSSYALHRKRTEDYFIQNKILKFAEFEN
jgi:hypothetical protein